MFKIFRVSRRFAETLRLLHEGSENHGRHAQAELDRLGKAGRA